MKSEKLKLYHIYGHGRDQAVKHIEEDGWGIVDFLTDPYSGCMIESNPKLDTEKWRMDGSTVAINLAAFGGRIFGVQSFFGDIYGHSRPQYFVPYMAYFNESEASDTQRYIIKDGPGLSQSPQTNPEKQSSYPGYFNAQIKGNGDDILGEFQSRGWIVKDYSELLPISKTSQRARKIGEESILPPNEQDALRLEYCKLDDDLEKMKNSHIDRILPDLEAFYGVYAHKLRAYY